MASRDEDTISILNITQSENSDDVQEVQEVLENNNILGTLNKAGNKKIYRNEIENGNEEELLDIGVKRNKKISNIQITDYEMDEFTIT